VCLGDPHSMQRARRASERLPLRKECSNGERCWGEADLECRPRVILVPPACMLDTARASAALLSEYILLIKRSRWANVSSLARG
jgi:hypothetical protein